jgi:Ca2+-binding RTX toxin-like protein
MVGPDAAHPFRWSHAGCGQTGAKPGLSLPGPALATGFRSEEGGASEIEVFIQSPHASIYVYGSNDGDAFILGKGGLNVNGDDDVDVVARGGERWVQGLQSGDDRFTTLGGGGTGTPFHGRVSLEGGRGGDVLIVGKSREALAEGKDGDDRIVGGKQDRGRQRLFGGDGRDVIRGGAGVDTLVGAEGPDSMVGGGGYDRCAKLGDDAIHSCESVVPHYRFLTGLTLH